VRAAAALTCVLALVGSDGLRAQPPAAPSLEGAWTLDKDLSDKPPDPSDSGSSTSGRRGNGGGYGRGFGGGRRRGGGMGGGRGGGAEDAQRVRDAVRDIMTAPDHLTIVRSDSMIILTSQDGRTTRLSADGKKVKDENTGIERKTTWDGGKLVSVITGIGRGTITQTYAIDPETHTLHVTLQMDTGRKGQPRTQNRVYQADKG
jgi:hypothetical protein